MKHAYGIAQPASLGLKFGSGGGACFRCGGAGLGELVDLADRGVHLTDALVLFLESAGDLADKVVNLGRVLGDDEE